MQASTRFGLARTKCKVQSAKYKIVFGRIDDCGNPEAKRDRGTLTGTGTGMGMGMGAD